MICFKGCQNKIDELTTSLNLALNQNNYYYKNQIERLKKHHAESLWTVKKQLEDLQLLRKVESGIIRKPIE